MTVADMPRLGALIARGLQANDPESLSAEVREWRESFSGLHYVRA